MNEFSYTRAASVQGASERAQIGAIPVAGGTNLIDLIKLDVVHPRELVDVNRIGWDRIERLPDDSVRIGANVRNSDLARDSLIRQRYPVLAEAILTGASAQLRNMATTAGNLLQRTRCMYFRDNLSPCNKRDPGSGCAAQQGYNRAHAIFGGSEHCIATHPSDMCVALAALEAQVLVTGKEGEKKIPIADLHLSPGSTPEREFALEAGDIITAVVLPPWPGARSWYVKIRDRESYEFALASAAVVVRFEGDELSDVRIVLGGVGTKPWRVPDAEDELRGKSLTRGAITEAARAAAEGARPLKFNWFKVELVRRVVASTLHALADRQPEVRSV